MAVDEMHDFARVMTGYGGFKIARRTQSMSERHRGLIRKGGPLDRLCHRLGIDLSVRPCHLR
jgi:hypothetical protein